ncbi:hypothetical protein ACOSQ2_019590 [Xanthoceras sorbifolium]
MGSLSLNCVPEDEKQKKNFSFSLVTQNPPKKMKNTLFFLSFFSGEFSHFFLEMERFFFTYQSSQKLTTCTQHLSLGRTSLACLLWWSNSPYGRRICVSP